MSMATDEAEYAIQDGKVDAFADGRRQGMQDAIDELSKALAGMMDPSKAALLGILIGRLDAIRDGGK